MTDEPTAQGDSPAGDDPAQESRLGEVLAAYFAGVEAGQSPMPQELIARHPEFARELAAFFADQERFGRFVAPLRPVVQAEAATPAGAEAATEPARVTGILHARTLNLDESRTPIADSESDAVT